MPNILAQRNLTVMITTVTNIVWENILTQEKSKKQRGARETVFRNNLFDELMRETSHRAM